MLLLRREYFAPLILRLAEHDVPRLLIVRQVGVFGGEHLEELYGRDQFVYHTRTWPEYRCDLEHGYDETMMQTGLLRGIHARGTTPVNAKAAGT